MKGKTIDYRYTVCVVCTKDHRHCDESLKPVDSPASGKTFGSIEDATLTIPQDVKHMYYIHVIVDTLFFTDGTKHDILAGNLCADYKN